MTLIPALKTQPNTIEFNFALIDLKVISWYAKQFNFLSSKKLFQIIVLDNS